MRSVIAGLLVLLVHTAEAAWLRYFPPTGAVTCVSAHQDRPCPPALGQDVVDIPSSLLLTLNQPGTCALLPEELAPFLRVTNDTPLTLGFVSPIVCFQGHLATTVAELHALRVAFDRAVIGERLSPLLAAVFAIHCTGATPAAGCAALRTRLLQDIPSVSDLNDAYIEFDLALQMLTGP
jgi:hypothetical protein